MSDEALPTMNPFNLNAYPSPVFPELGVEVSSLVSDAISLPAGSRARAIEALTAVRRFLQHGGGREPSASTGGALLTLSLELESVEIALRDLEDGCSPDALMSPTERPGRRPASRAELAFQARCVVGVRWMQILASGKLSKADAQTAVAKLIPRALCQMQRHVRLTEREQLEAWLDASGRKGSRQHGAVLDTWWQLTDRLETGESRLEDASSTQIVEWVRAAIT